MAYRFEVSKAHKERIRAAYDRMLIVGDIELAHLWLQTRFGVKRFAELPWVRHEAVVQAFETQDWAHFAAGEPDYFAWFTPSRPASAADVRL